MRADLHRVLPRFTPRVRALLWAALLAGAWLAGPAAAPLQAQQAPVQYVESLEKYRTRIEGLVNERLSTLVPSQNYVMRAFVQGERVQVPIGEETAAGVELPGFRRTRVEQTTTEGRFQVNQIVVRVVLHENLPEEDLRYIRTVIPILADLDPTRGDRLDLQVVPPGQPAPAETPAAVQTAPFPPEETAPFDFSLRDWLLLGALGLMLLILLIVLLRVFLLSRTPKAERRPEPVAPAAPPPAPRREDEAAKLAAEEAQAREKQERLDTLRQSVVKGLFARPDLGRQLVQAWQGQGDKLSTLVHGLGTMVSRQALMPHMGREGYRALEEAVVQEDPPDADKMIAVLREGNLFLITQDLAQPEELETDPFPFLSELSRGQVAHLIKDEPVKVKAIVLSRVDPAITAEILEEMPQDMQLAVAVQIGNFQALPLDMLSDVAKALADKSRKLPDARTVDIQGPRALVDLMGRTSPDTSRYLLQAIKTKDRKLAEAVEERFFLFDAIPLVPEEQLPQVVRTMPSQTVIQALQGADQEIQRKVILAFPEQARTGLVTSLRAAKFDPETVAEARRQLVAHFQAQAAQGRIDLKQISDAWQQRAEAS